MIAANDAIIQCNVPSFVSDFVTVDAWVTSEGETILRTGNIGNLFPLNRLKVHGFTFYALSIDGGS